MNIKDNKHFRSVQPFNVDITIQDIQQLEKTRHSKSSHYNNRMNYAKKFGYCMNSDRVLFKFLVDKGHPEGPEIHCLTKQGVIYILNARKYMTHHPCLITVLFARPMQYIRLLDTIHVRIPKETLNYCKKWSCTNTYNA